MPKLTHRVLTSLSIASKGRSVEFRGDSLTNNPVGVLLSRFGRMLADATQADDLGRSYQLVFVVHVVEEEGGIHRVEISH